MKNTSCDILIVGAGPAGASAAISAANLGARVVIAERREKIGIPVRCAEYIPAQLLGEMDMGKDFIVQSVSGMKTWLPDGAMVETAAAGFTIHRDKFDQGLAKKARDAGAELRLSSTVLHYRKGAVTLKDKHGIHDVLYPRVIIGADGPHSRVGKWMNLTNRNLIPAIQARVPLKMPLSHTEVYFDKLFFGGYGWLFPKGGEANVGLGRKKNGKQEPGMELLLRRFIDRLAEDGKVIPRILKKFGGWIPAEDVRSATAGNMLLAGDAAGQTHPITGGGIAPAVICGKMAGKWAAEAVFKQDLTVLTEYDREWIEMFSRTNKRGYERRLLLEAQWDRLNNVVQKCWVAFRAYYAET